MRRKSGLSGYYKSRNFNMNIINDNSGPLATRPEFLSPPYAANGHSGAFSANPRNPEYSNCLNPNVPSQRAWRGPLPEFTRRFDPNVHQYGDSMSSSSRSNYPSSNPYDGMPDVVPNYFGHK